MRRATWVVCTVAAVTGCQPEPLQAEAGAFREIGPDADEAATTRPREASPAAPEAPAGYKALKPMLRTGRFGHAILLLDASTQTFLPIFIGGTEALSIQLRLAGEAFTRPLTHDLFDGFARKMGARLIRSQVDSLVDGVYFGTVVFERERPGEAPEIFSLDARTSDAIALAIGNGVPIYVAESVLEEAGITADDLGDDGAPSGARPQNPIAL